MTGVHPPDPHPPDPPPQDPQSPDPLPPDPQPDPQPRDQPPDPQPQDPHHPELAADPLAIAQRPLRANRHYQRLFVARTVSNIGNGILPIALAFGILGLPDGSPTALSVVLAAQAVPMVLMLPIGGVVGDRFGRARVIGAADITISVISAIMAGLFLTDQVQIPLLALLAALAGVLHALWYPAFSGLVPEVVVEEHIQPANAYLSVASNGGLIVGNAIGGLLVAAAGSGVAIALDGLTFLIAGMLVFSFRSVSTPVDSGESMLSDLRAGWHVFLSFRWVVVVVAAFSVIVMALRGAEEVMGPVLALQEYGGAKGWAVVLASQSAGLLLGALTASRIRIGRPMLFGMLVMLTLPLWLMTLALALPLPVVSLAAFAWGVSIELFSVFWFTALHRNIPRHALSRVGSYDAMGSLMFGPIGLALAGPLIALVGLEVGFTIAAVLTLVAILAAVADPSVRNQRA